jgi:hypothetical protein
MNMISKQTHIDQFIYKKRPATDAAPLACAREGSAEDAVDLAPMLYGKPFLEVKDTLLTAIGIIRRRIRRSNANCSTILINGICANPQRTKV